MTPSSEPAAAFPIASQAQFISRSLFNGTIERLAPDQQLRLAAALVVSGRARSSRASERINPVLVIAPDPQTVDAWLATTPGVDPLLRFTTLDATAVYLNEIAARQTGALVGETIDFYLGARPTQVQVRGILPPEILPRAEPVVFLSLPAAQVLLGHPEQVNAVLIQSRPAGSRLNDLPIVPLPASSSSLQAALEEG